MDSSDYGSDYQIKGAPTELPSRKASDKQMSDAQLAATIDASERAAKNSVTYTKEVGQFANNLSKNGNKSSLQDAIAGAREASSLKRSEEDDKARNIAAELGKDRDNESFLKRGQMATDVANNANNIQGQKDLAQISQKTQLAEQKSAEERATIAAKAQVSAAVLGNKQSYGGYW